MDSLSQIESIQSNGPLTWAAMKAPSNNLSRMQGTYCACILLPASSQQFNLNRDQTPRFRNSAEGQLHPNAVRAPPAQCSFGQNTRDPNNGAARPLWLPPPSTTSRLSIP